MHRSVGVWRSLVAHFAGGEGVVGSNPITPTINPSLFKQCSCKISLTSLAQLVVVSTFLQTC